MPANREIPSFDGLSLTTNMSRAFNSQVKEEIGRYQEQHLQRFQRLPRPDITRKSCATMSESFPHWMGESNKNFLMNSILFNCPSRDAARKLLAMLLNDHIPVYDIVKRMVNGNTIQPVFSHRKQSLNEVLFEPTTKLNFEVARKRLQWSTNDEAGYLSTSEITEQAKAMRFLLNSRRRASRQFQMKMMFHLI
jgi:hypothetical protein